MCLKTASGASEENSRSQAHTCSRKLSLLLIPVREAWASRSCWNTRATGTGFTRFICPRRPASFKKERLWSVFQRFVTNSVHLIWLNGILRRADSVYTQTCWCLSTSWSLSAADITELAGSFTVISSSGGRNSLLVLVEEKVHCFQNKVSLRYPRYTYVSKCGELKT